MDPPLAFVILIDLDFQIFVRSKSLFMRSRNRPSRPLSFRGSFTSAFTTATTALTAFAFAFRFAFIALLFQCLVYINLTAWVYINLRPKKKLLALYGI